MNLEIKLPSLAEQKDYVEKMRALEKIRALCACLEPSEQPSYLKRYNEGYEPPTPEIIRDLFKPYSGSQLGNLLGVEARTVRRWIGGDVVIPYAIWRLYLNIITKVVD